MVRREVSREGAFELRGFVRSYRAAAYCLFPAFLILEIVDPLTRSQLRHQPSRLLATSGPSLSGLIGIAIFRGYRRIWPSP